MKAIYEHSEKCIESQEFDISEIRQITENILQFFPKLKPYIGLLYFYHDFPIYQEAATFFPLDVPVDFDHLKPVITKYAKLNFAFHFSKPITFGNTISRVLNIAHELQHAVQYQESKKHYYYGRILWHFVNNRISQYEFPPDYDADLKAKAISYLICGKKEVDQFIKGLRTEIGSKAIEYEKYFFSLDESTNFNWKSEVLRLWQYYSITSKIERLLEKARHTENEKMAVKMYIAAKDSPV